jgi:hypothetical protein
VADDEDEAAAPALPPWQTKKVTLEEAIMLLMNEAEREENMQARLVRTGDRTSVYEPAMRKVHVLRHIAGYLNDRLVEAMAKKYRQRGRG